MLRPSRKSLFAAALALGLLFALPGFATPPNGHPQGKHGADIVTVHYCDDDSQVSDGSEDTTRDRVVYDGPEWMWPPNHKYRDLTVTARSDDPQEQVALATEGTHDEYSDPDSHTGEMNGAGNTEGDIDPFMDSDMGEGSAQTQHSVRSERSGRGDGRIYTIMFQAEFNGDSCMGEFTIEVPHDMGRGAENKNVHEPEVNLNL